MRELASEDSMDKWKPGDPPSVAQQVLEDFRRHSGAVCQFCGRQGSQELWKGYPAHTRCLDAEPPLSAGERAAQEEPQP